MKHIPCHLHDGAIFKLCHSVLLRPIHDGHSFLNAMILQETLGCLRNDFPTVVQPKRLDFVTHQFKCAFAPSICSDDLQCFRMSPIAFDHSI
jgi:hypothetical protein